MSTVNNGEALRQSFVAVPMLRTMYLPITRDTGDTKYAAPAIPSIKLRGCYEITVALLLLLAVLLVLSSLSRLATLISQQPFILFARPRPHYRDKIAVIGDPESLAANCSGDLHSLANW